MIDSDADDNVKELVKMLDNTHLDKLDSASSKVEEAKELLIKECSDHIDMARTQRFLYQSLEAPLCLMPKMVLNTQNGVQLLPVLQF